MNKLIIFPILLILFFVTNSFSNSLDSLRLEKKDGKNFVIHKVSKGQTLFGTLRKYGTTLSEYKAANPNVETDIKIGQLLRIPYFKTIKEATKVTAQTKNTSAKSIDTLVLKVENENVINYEKYYSTPPKVAVVESGNTLFKIAKKTGAKVPDIKKLNNLTTDLIEIGQVLIVKEGTIIKGKAKRVVDFEKNIAIRNFKATEALVANNTSETEPIKAVKKDKVAVQKDALEVAAVVPAPKVEEKKVVVTPKVETTKKSDTTPAKSTISDSLPTAKPATPKPETILRAEDVDNATPRTVKIEEGIAEIIEVESKSGKYLALHKSAPLGTLVQVRNETNGASVWVKVIGRLPELDQNQNIIIKLSPRAMDRVSPVDKRFRAKINYSL